MGMRCVQWWPLNIPQGGRERQTDGDVRADHPHQANLPDPLPHELLHHALQTGHEMCAVVALYTSHREAGKGRLMEKYVHIIPTKLIWPIRHPLPHELIHHVLQAGHHES